MTEKEYRELKVDSYSSIKLFIDDRKKYFRKFILEEPVDDEESESLTFGQLVDTLLFTPGEFDQKFAISKVQSPTGLMAQFVDALFKRTLESRSEDGTVTRSMESRMQEAYNDVKFDKDGNIVAFKRDSFETVVGKFSEKDPELYFNEKLNAIGKTVIDRTDQENAERGVAKLRRHPVIGPIVNLQTNDRFEVKEQFPIVFEYKDYPLKCLLDKFIIDHETKMVFPYDLKTCWNVDQFAFNFIKYKYYIQLCIYTLGVADWLEQEGWKDYEIAPFKFITLDSANYMEPLLYDTDMENFMNGLNGFTLNGKEYVGVHKAVEDLKFHRETGIWTIAADHQKTNGLVKLKAF